MSLERMCVKMTIGQFATLSLQKGKSAQETLDLVKAVFPNCSTSIKCIYYYASKAKIGLKKAQVVDDVKMKEALKMLKAA